MKILINTFMAFYFFVGMDIIYWRVHDNDVKPIVFTYIDRAGETKQSARCYDNLGKKWCLENDYMVSVKEYKGVGAK